ncbi:MAG: ferrous iron transporter B, partial [Clostridia bacterium]
KDLLAPESSLVIALAGNPNSGKSTLFNVLTGSNQKIGNWPGVTVEQKFGKYVADKSVTIVDLPGIYSLSPFTIDEEVAHNYLINSHPDLIIDIVDSTNIERNLLLTTQLLELDVPVVVALNMEDEANSLGLTFNKNKMEEIFGVKFFSISAVKETGIDELMEYCLGDVANCKHPLTYTPKIEEALNKILSFSTINANKRWLSIKLLENDSKVISQVPATNLEQLREVNKQLAVSLGDTVAATIAKLRYDRIETVVKKTSSIKTKANASPLDSDSALKNSDTQSHEKDKLSITDKIDRIVTNKWLAFPIFILVMLAVFYISVDGLGGLLNSLITDSLTPWLQIKIADGLASVSSPLWLISLIVDGIITGVFGVLSFLPQIMLLFGLIAVLEA